MTYLLGYCTLKDQMPDDLVFAGYWFQVSPLFCLRGTMCSV